MGVALLLADGVTINSSIHLKFCEQRSCHFHRWYQSQVVRQGEHVFLKVLVPSVHETRSAKLPGFRLFVQQGGNLHVHPRVLLSQDDPWPKVGGFVSRRDR